VSMMRSILFFGLAVLAGTLLLNLAKEFTQDRREQNAALHESRMLTEVLPEQDYDEPPGLTSFAIHDPQEQDDEALVAFPVYREGSLTAVVVALSEPGGYVGPIRLLVGIDAAGRVTGVRATEHRETPGLGDKIDAGKSGWIDSFEGYALGELPAARWELRRDGGHFDHISGATITSRAVMRAVRRAVKAHATWQSDNTDKN
jgi:electron transport complex protein RnfG